MQRLIKNNDLLASFGFKTSYSENAEKNEINIECENSISHNDITFIVSYSSKKHEGKHNENRYYAISETVIKNSVHPEGKTIKVDGTIEFLFGEWNLIPGKNFIEEIIGTTKADAWVDNLWLLARELLLHSASFIHIKRIKQIFKEKEVENIRDFEKYHPLMKETKRNHFAFTSREMLEYSLAKELNKKNINSNVLKHYISSHTLPFLEYKMGSSFRDYQEIIKENAEWYSSKQFYEKAWHMRSSEKRLIVEVLKKSWPIPEKEDYEEYWIKFVQQYELPLNKNH